MQNRARSLIPVLGITLLGLALGCSGGGGSQASLQSDPAEPEFDPGSFVAGQVIDHPHLPLAPGTGATFETQTPSGLELSELFVSHDTQSIAGVECTILVDRVHVDGDLVEETFSYHAQDRDGNVWTLGEDCTEFHVGLPVSTEGWEAFVDGAAPGLLMKKSHVLGDIYARESAPGVAEDRVEVIALNVPVILADGTTYACLQTREFSPLEPTDDEMEYYAEGVGLVLEENADGSRRAELVAVSSDTRPDIDPADFVAAIDNDYFPLAQGDYFLFEKRLEEGVETVEKRVLFDTRRILGVSCSILHVVERVNGELTEVTSNWHVQDKNGRVWYFGEDSTEIEDGDPVTSVGSWEAGVQDAQPGASMPARPRVGDSFRLEYAPGVAEEIAVIVARDVTVTVPYGTFEGCVQVLEWDTVSGDRELKYYAPGIGLVLETLPDGSGRLELVDVIR